MPPEKIHTFYDISFQQWISRYDIPRSLYAFVVSLCADGLFMGPPDCLEAAEMNLQIAEEKYRTGAINSFNYRDIQLIYLNSAFRRLQAIYDLIDSHTNLTRLTGGFLDETE